MARKSRRDKTLYSRVRRKIRTSVKSSHTRSLIRLRSLRKMRYGKYRVRHGKIVRMSRKNPSSLRALRNKTWTYKGFNVFPADRNSSGIHWYTRTQWGILKTDTKDGMRQIITSHLKLK